MIGTINSHSKVLIRNTKEPDREAWIDLPYSDEDFEELLESIGVIVDDEEETDTYDLLMRGESITKFEIVRCSSAFLSDEHFADLDAANELVDRLESLSEWKEELVLALVKDGDSLDEAITIAEAELADFYSNTTLESLAREYADEGYFTQKFLMNFIDFEAVVEALVDDGYVEVNGGVLRRDN